MDTCRNVGENRWARGRRLSNQGARGRTRGGGQGGRAGGHCPRRALPGLQPRRQRPGVWKAVRGGRGWLAGVDGELVRAQQGCPQTQVCHEGCLCAENREGLGLVAPPNQRHLPPGRPSAPQGPPQQHWLWGPVIVPCGPSLLPRHPAGWALTEAWGGLARGPPCMGQGHVGLPGRGGRLRVGSQVPRSTPAPSPELSTFWALDCLIFTEVSKHRPRSTGCTSKVAASATYKLKQIRRLSKDTQPSQAQPARDTR